MSNQDSAAPSNDFIGTSDNFVTSTKLGSSNGVSADSESSDIMKNVSTAPSSRGIVSLSSSTGPLSTFEGPKNETEGANLMPMKGVEGDLIIEERGKRTAPHNFENSGTGIDESHILIIICSLI